MFIPVASSGPSVPDFWTPGWRWCIRDWCSHGKMFHRLVDRHVPMQIENKKVHAVAAFMGPSSCFVTQSCEAELGGHGVFCEVFLLMMAFRV